MGIEQRLLVTSTLLPPNLEARRLGTPVALYSVKGDPRRPPEGTPNYKTIRKERGELDAVRMSMLNAYDIHGECNVPGRLALIRKMTPHGINEMTVMAQEGYNDRPIDNIIGFPPEIRQSFYRVGTSFANFSEERNLYPVVSYTYDPRTNDRKTAQSVKIFHLQLTARAPEELHQMQEIVHPLGEEINNIQRRQLVDESSIAYSLALTDYFHTNPLVSMSPVAPFTEDNCSNIRFRVGTSWEDMLNPQFDQDLQTLHNAMNQLYHEFETAAMSGESGDWQRPRLSQEDANTHLDTLSWMQVHTRETLKHFILGLKQKHLQRTEQLKARGLTSHVYPLDGFCYGATMTRSNNGEIMLSIRPQTFAETGSTGLQYIDPVGAHVKIGRDTGMYDETELKDKRRFEKDCTSYIIQNV
ncbi:MAG: hypothetical protein ACR2LN_00375 [Candidatus Levyibacteriota bacterium]